MQAGHYRRGAHTPTRPLANKRSTALGGASARRSPRSGGQVSVDAGDVTVFVVAWEDDAGCLLPKSGRHARVRIETVFKIARICLR
jgi:hypothetical protein